MKMDNIYLGNVVKIMDIKTTYSLVVVKSILLLKKKDRYIDIQDKKVYGIIENNNKVGDEVVNQKSLIPFLKVLNNLGIKYNKKNISKKEFVKLLK